MRHSRLFVVTAFVAASVLPLIAHAARIEVRHDSITGRVFNSSTNEGVPGLSVRLIAPRAEKLPVRITTTSTDGKFSFSGLRQGKYLLLMYQGTALVFRKEIDTSVETSFTVPLHPVT